MMKFVASIPIRVSSNSRSISSCRLFLPFSSSSPSANQQQSNPSSRRLFYDTTNTNTINKNNKSIIIRGKQPQQKTDHHVSSSSLSPVASGSCWGWWWNNNNNNNSNNNKISTTTTPTTTTRTTSPMTMMNHQQKRHLATTTTTADDDVTTRHLHRPDPVKVVVVGSNGRMGQIRTQIINSNPKFELVAIIDHDLDQAINMGNKYRVPSYPNLSSTLQEQDHNIDGIVCCSPTFTHKEIIETCVQHNNDNDNDNDNNNVIKGIFVEKPVAATANEIESLFNLVDGNNNNNNLIKLCCGFQRRFDLSYVQAKDYVRDGHIGSVITANIFFGDHPCPSQEFLLQEGGGGNIFQDLCAHDVDYILQVLKNNNNSQKDNEEEEDIIEIESVYAIGSSSTTDLANCNVQDNGTMLLKTKSGIVITIFMSRSATYGYDQRCEIFGTKGKVSVGNVHENSTTLATNHGLLQSKLQHSFPQRFEHAFQFEMDTFADVLVAADSSDDDESNKMMIWPITKSDCIQVQQIADAALESSITGQIVNLL